jgi:hypothetical protein
MINSISIAVVPFELGLTKARLRPRRRRSSDRLLRSFEKNARKRARQAKPPCSTEQHNRNQNCWRNREVRRVRKRRLPTGAQVFNLPHKARPPGKFGRRRRKNQGGLACVLRLFHSLLTRAALLTFSDSPDQVGDDGDVNKQDCHLGRGDAPAQFIQFDRDQAGGGDDCKIFRPTLAK